MSDTWREMAEQGQSQTCLVCGKKIRWGDRDAMWGTLSKVSWHNACRAKYTVRRVAT